MVKQATNSFFEKYFDNVISEVNRHISGKENDSNYLSLMNTFLSDYVNSNTFTFEYNCILFGSKSTLNLNILNILDFLTPYYSNKKASLFYSSPTREHFSLLINAYSYNIITCLEAFNHSSFPQSFLESDLTLTALFSALFFPEALIIISKLLLLFLEKKYNDNSALNIRPIKGTYGRDSILILLVEILKFSNNHELANSIYNFCMPENEPLFKNVTEKVHSSYQQDFAEYIDTLLRFHVTNSKSSDLTLPFHTTHWQFFPIEIFILIYFRKKQIPETNFLKPCIQHFLSFMDFQNLNIDYMDSFTKCIYNKALLKAVQS